MSKTYIDTSTRQTVIQRAGSCCEYCLIDTNARAIEFAIDHIVAEKHGGETHTDNLCLSCYWCNSYKGSDISSVDWSHDKAIIPLFNPRQQVWSEHFQIDGVRINPISATGRVTTFLLQMNSVERIKERRTLLELGVYPCIPSL